MNEGTRAAIEALLKSDSTVAPDHRRAILDVCDKRTAGTETPDRLLTMKEASARTGKCTRTLFRWIQDGRLKPVRLTARLFQLREADLLRIVDQEERNQAAAPVPERLREAMKYAKTIKGRKAERTP